MLLDLLEPPGRCSGCWPHDGEVDGCAVEESGCGRTMELGRSRRTLMMMMLLLLLLLWLLLLLRPPRRRRRWCRRAARYGVVAKRRH